MLEDFPTADINVSIVWIQMPGFNDNDKTANQIAQTIKDKRVRHFYDPLPAHRAGKAFAKSLIAEGRGPAWDIYMFYNRAEQWDGDPPKPAEFMHQLSGGQRADPAHFCTGGDLIDSLHEAMHKVTGAQCEG